MRTTTKLSMLLGAGIMTAVIGAAPAQASPAPPPGHDDDVIAYFDNRSDCFWVARMGQRHWDDPECNPVRFGPYRGMWALTSGDDDNDHWQDQGQGQNWPRPRH
ncbi:hypothetical protein [Paractinoplanes toevensis]|uniref:Secreted protein n=1 Tax=Paractinoplanes toevensis TaxID=571911 RepID=A0A919T8H8_9ACTN|nr:hypothetical protein [Actinoplanes toevensis]GIM90960.1 hypothetical protein Ato02nite_027530 [Actinoplanes toevensis]